MLIQVNQFYPQLITDACVKTVVLEICFEKKIKESLVKL